MNFNDKDWSAYPGPRFYRPGNVPEALARLGAATTEATANDAYQHLLSTIGNNHAGTLYPAALPAIDFVVELARSDSRWARFAAREVLRDCATSFQAEPGFEVAVHPDGSQVDLTSAIRQRIADSGIDLDL